MMMLQKSSVGTVSRAPRALPASLILPARRRVAVRYQDDEKSEAQRRLQQSQYNRADSPFYGDFGEDPADSLRAGWEKLKNKWDDWEPEKRNQTLAWGGGGLLALYLANGLIAQVDRLPILPQLLQLVGFAFTSWFTFRYLLYAEGREDLSRLSLDQLLGRADSEASAFTSDFAKGWTEGAEGVSDAGDRLRKSEVGRGARDVARAVGDAGSDGSSRLSDGSKGGYSETEVKGNIKGAMKDLDRL